MNEDKEAFLSRWSRRKTEAREAPEEEEPRKELPEQLPQPPVELPKVEDLTPESDFAPFMNPKVDEGTRRAALKKLFADSRFNVPDPFEAYSEDYTGGEPIPLEMLKTLNHARKLLFEEAEKTAQAGTEQAQEAPQDPKDGAGRQDA